MSDQYDNLRVSLVEVVKNLRRELIVARKAAREMMDALHYAKQDRDRCSIWAVHAEEYAWKLRGILRANGIEVPEYDDGAKHSDGVAK